MIRETFEVTGEQEGQRLDKLLHDIYPQTSRSFFQKLIEDGGVTVEEQPRKVSYRLRCHQLISVSIPDAASVSIKAEDIPLDILYEDDDLLVVNKQKGMVVHPSAGHLSGTLVNAVLFHCGESLSGINGQIRPGIVHRIDKDTTGALVVCKNDESHRKVAEQIKAHTVHRFYVGIVCGNVKEDRGTIDSPIGRHPTNRKRMCSGVKDGREAVTDYEVLERFGSYTYMKFCLHTGRTHQIRAHMAGIGHPLLGDELYGGAQKGFGDLRGQCLHAQLIGLIHPTTGEYLQWEAPLPPYFAALLEKLRKTKP